MDSPQNPEEWAAVGKRVLAGDDKASVLLADELGKRAFAFLRERPGLSRQEVWDLTPELVCHVFLKLNKFRGNPRKFMAWIYAIWKNKWNDALRRRRVSCSPLEERDLNRPIQEVSSNGSLDEPARAALAEGWASLDSDEDRKVLEYRYGGREPMPYNGIAKELGTSAGGARQRHRRAIEKLHTFLLPDPRIQSWLARHCGPSPSTISPSTEHERPGE